MKMCRYIYENIDSHKGEVRILVLLPGFWQDDITCQLGTVSLEEKPFYETLSYVWGSLSDTKPITLQGCVAQVVVNLEAALRHIRRTDASCFLWVDSLCIDQQNNHEKSQQVAMMGRIYGACSRVYIWLGEPSPSAQEKRRRNLLRKAAQEAGHDPFRMVHHFSDNKHISELSCFRPSKLRKKKLIFSEKAEFKAIWKAFMEPVRSPWWSRFWCVQESLLPRKAEVVFGRWQVSLSVIKKAVTNHRRHLTSCCSEAAANMPDDHSWYYDTLLLNLSQLRPGAPVVSDLSDKCEDSRPYSDLDSVLRAYRHKDCKDPRDKVYGILGLIDQSKHSGISPDYSLSVAQVYTNAMISVISNAGGDLRCLTGSGFHSQNNVNRLPSWVRDLSLRPDRVAMTYERLRLQRYDIYKTAGEQSLSNARIGDDHTLHLRGFKIDEIVKIGSVISRRDWQHVIAVLEQWHYIAGITPTHNINILKQDQGQKAFWKTVIGDALANSDSEWRRMSDQETEDYMNWISGNVASWKHMTKPLLEESFVEANLTSIYDRAFIVTRKGNFGLCPSNGRKGDEIWLLEGARVPFILRPGQHGYTFIGESYVHGFMDGEAVEVVSLKEQEVSLR